MGRIVSYEPCPKCISNGKDSRGDNLARYDDGGGHCFACKYHEFPKHYIPKKEVEYVPKSLRPADYTRDVPAYALKWLLQYGLPWSYWKDTIGYSPAEERLVFGVGTPLQFSIGRFLRDPRDAIGESQSMPAPRKWYVWGDCHKHTEVVGGNIDGPIILVEDLISAHKVATSQAAVALPLFGTKIHPCHLYYLINENKPVVLWLDKDQELNVKKQAWQLESVINRPVKVVITEQDPKMLSIEDIKKELNA